MPRSARAPSLARLATRDESRSRKVEAVGSVRDAVRGADIICTTTVSKEPVLEHEWLSPGVHINAVGSSTATARELDTRTVVDATFFVDRRESTLSEAGDFLIPLAEGAVTPAHIRAELGDLLIAVHPGRTSREELTVFKSLGLGIEDVTAARRAVVLGLGRRCDVGGTPHGALTLGLSPADSAA